jgi:hypothetical protein
MNSKGIAFLAALTVIAVSPVVLAHEVQSISGNQSTANGHTHVYKRSGYGGNAVQGHAVDNSLGSIVIWSPAPAKNYGTTTSPRMVPRTEYKFPSNPQYGRDNKQYGKDNIQNYGKDYRKGYGK